MYSMASVACKNWHPDTTSGTYLPQNTREASYAIFPIDSVVVFQYRNEINHFVETNTIGKPLSITSNIDVLPAVVRQM